MPFLLLFFNCTGSNNGMGIKLKGETILLFRIVKTLFHELKDVRNLASILLGKHGEGLFDEATMFSSPPLIRTVARKVIQKWIQENGRDARGGKLFKALADNLVGAANIAMDFKDRLIPSESRYLLAVLTPIQNIIIGKQ